MLNIYVDADACPVKQEVCRVAGRCGLTVTFVANSPMRVPDPGISRLVVVGSGFDEADDWIVNQVLADDIVVTADILLANRCIGRGARVIGPAGRPFTLENIGQAMAMRELMSDLREAGNIAGGPPPFQKKDRSRFLHQFDQMIQALKRNNKK
ncbi:YaiI/YqxD family protein [uncultured Desulfosarcina sp.]|uniref:YaiI/YqxD family protein n=1 Tax=uncultured Desulfosarcina sp. TaxID=218289 RepID=UPI003749844F